MNLYISMKGGKFKNSRTVVAKLIFRNSYIEGVLVFSFECLKLQIQQYEGESCRLKNNANLFHTRNSTHEHDFHLFTSVPTRFKYLGHYFSRLASLIVSDRITC